MLSTPADRAPLPDLPITQPDGCTVAARWIYLVSSEGEFLRFEPDTRRLSTVATLRCSRDAEPFSMAVDRSATAWVLYNDGSVYKVDVTTGVCTPTTFRGTRDVEIFGMGFSTDGSGATEQLFVAGGTTFSMEASDTSRFGVLDTATLGINETGTTAGWPELTGTGSGELWGFSPGELPPRIRKLDKTTGASVVEHRVSGTPNAPPRAWAFAFWGGRFFLFLKAGFEMSSRIYEFDPATQRATEVVGYTGHSIVGAGVSTCAPIIFF